MASHWRDIIVTRPFNPNMAFVNQICETLQANIEDYRNQNFETFGLNVRVHPVTTSAPVIDLKGRMIGFERYSFDLWDTDKVMKVRVYPKGEVKIKYMGRWCHVASFLKHLKPQVDWNDATVAEGFTREQIVLGRWAQQSRWWLANGKKFPLLDLAPEVREIIYGHVWGEFIEPYPTSKARKLPPATKWAMQERKPNSNLLRTCRLVSEETSNILFMHTPFYVEHYGVMGPLTSNPKQRIRIRQLELSLSHDDFMRLFRNQTVRRSGLIIPRGSPEALALRQMKLSRLQLVFQPPSFTTRTGVFDGACQKAAVERILQAAWPFIRGHPIELSGYMKTSQKTTFEAAYLVQRKLFELWQKQRAIFGLAEGDLREYDDELDEEDGGVILSEGNRRLSEALETERVEAEVADAPVNSLECRCRVPCTLEHWTWED